MPMIVRANHRARLDAAIKRAPVNGPARSALTGTGALVVLDEVQARPELFSTLRVLVDRARPTSRFLILGSASPSLVRGLAESLAGRVEFVDLRVSTLARLGPADGSGSGCATAFHARGWLDRKPTAYSGARASSGRTSSETGIRRRSPVAAPEVFVCRRSPKPTPS